MAETRWFYKETYCGCVIQETYEGSGIFGSPCTVYLRFEISRVKADIRAKGYCDTTPPPPPPPPPPTGPEASIIEINLPTELEAGAMVVGNVKIKNIGDAAGGIRAFVTTMWDNKDFVSGSGSLAPGATHQITLTAGSNIRMPNANAEIRIRAQHLEDGVWETDDTRTH